MKNHQVKKKIWNLLQKKNKMLILKVLKILEDQKIQKNKKYPNLHKLIDPRLIKRLNILIHKHTRHRTPSALGYSVRQDRKWCQN